MGGAPERDVLAHRHPRGDLGVLGDERHDPGAGALLHPRDRPALQADRPGAHPAQPGHRLDEGRLARPVGTDHRAPRPGLDARDDVVDQVAAARAHGEALDLDRVHRTTGRRRLRMTTKTGAPTRAVTTPRGSSDGATTVRATVSARTRNAAPDHDADRQDPPVGGPDQESHDVRDDDADEADQPHRRDDRRGPQGGRGDDDEAHAAHRQAQRARLVLAHAHDVERPARRHAHRGADHDVGQHQQHRVPARGGQRPEQPDVDARDRAGRGLLEVRLGAREQRRHGDAGQDQRRGVRAHPPPADRPGHRDRRERPDEGERRRPRRRRQPRPMSTMAIVAPRPAPAATPRR